MRVLLTYPAQFLSKHLQDTMDAKLEWLTPSVDYRRQDRVEEAFREYEPDAVVLETPFAGGIQYNINHQADLITANLQVQTNVIATAHRFGVKRLVFIGSSCMYPRAMEGPMSESDLGTGTLEPTNAAFATAKIAGMQMTEAYRKQFGREYYTLIPANLYGPYDDCDEVSGHVIGALMARMHLAKRKGQESVSIWGSGKPIRDFLYAADFAKAVMHWLQHDGLASPVNVSSGTGIAIRDLAFAIRDTVGYSGELVFDFNKPDGMLIKLLDCSKAQAQGWEPSTSLADGLAAMYQWFGATRE